MENKKTNKNIKRIGMIVILAILITGIIMMCTAKFHFSMDYAPHERIEIYIGKQTNKEEIEQIAKDVFGNQEVKVQEIEVFHDMVALTVRQVTQEQKDRLMEKVNAKYETQLTQDTHMAVYSVANLRGRDMVKNYIAPIGISTILIFAFALIRYRNLGWIKLCGKMIGLVILVEAIYLSLIAITRLPISQYTLPFGLVIGILTVMGILIKQETQLQRLEGKVKKENKK